MRRVDSHCHLWDLSRGDYHWLDVNEPSLQAIARNFAPNDLLSASASSLINDFIVVQAAATEQESHYLLSLADENENIAGVVGWVDLESTDASASLEQFARHAKFKGIRPMLQDIENTQWLLQVPQPISWQRLIELNLRFDALVQPRHLHILYQFCQQHPSLPVVIDHAAKPAEAFAGQTEAYDQWAADIRVLGKRTQSYCKVSGLFTELPTEVLTNPLSAIEPVFDQLLESFGPSRLMWGSDWPVLTLASGYSAWNDTTLQLITALSQDEQAMILGGSAAQFYGLWESA